MLQELFFGNDISNILYTEDAPTLDTPLYYIVPTLASTKSLVFILSSSKRLTLTSLFSAVLCNFPFVAHSIPWALHFDSSGPP